MSLGTTTAVSTRTHPHATSCSSWSRWRTHSTWGSPSSGRRGAYGWRCNRDEVHGFMKLSSCTVCVEAVIFALLCPWKALHSCCCAINFHQCLWQTTACVTSTWPRCCIAPRCVGIIQKHTVLCCSQKHCPARASHPCVATQCNQLRLRRTQHLLHTLVTVRYVLQWRGMPQGVG